MRTRAALLLALGACAGTPPLLPNAVELVEEADGLRNAGDWAAARDLLATHDRRSFPKRIQDRYDLILGGAHHALGDHWAAFETIRDFADRTPHSELRGQIIHLEYEVGRRLILSDAGFLFFWSDRRAGRTVLEHLITRYPDNAHLADALRLLGEAAFADGNYLLAQERFRDLLRRRPESEWAPLARFRFAMSIFARLQGPDYDLDEMQRASRELEDFLADPPENPGFVAEAREALTTLREWQAERHLSIASFYRRIGNDPGYHSHLRKAAEGFRDTPAGTRAADLLQQREDAAARRTDGSTP